MGAGDRAFAPPRRLHGCALPREPEVRHRVGGPVRAVDRGAPEEPRPGRLRRSRPRRRGDDRRVRGTRGPLRHGRVVGVRGGGRRGPGAAGAAARGGDPPPPPGARSQRRGIRQLRRSRGALRHHPSPGTRRRTDQRELAVGDRRLDDEPDGVGPRRRPPHHPRRGQRGRAGARRSLLVGGRRSAHQGGHVLRGDDARRGRDRTRPRRAPIRGQAGADLRAAGPLRGGAALDRGAHGGARREHRSARRLAEGLRRRAGRGPRDDVRSRGPARASSAAPDRRDRGCVPVRRRLHALRRGGGCGGAQPAFVRDADEARAPPGAPLVRVAEQPARRDRPGRRGDGDVRRCPHGARERSGDRSGRLRCVPAPSARGAPVGRPRPVHRGGPPTVLGGGLRLGVDEPPWLRRRGEVFHGDLGRAPVPAGASRGHGRDPSARRLAARPRPRGPGPGAAPEPRPRAPGPPRPLGAARRGDRGPAPGAVRGPQAEGGSGPHAGGGGGGRPDDPLGRRGQGGGAGAAAQGEAWRRPDRRPGHRCGRGRGRGGAACGPASGGSCAAGPGAGDGRRHRGPGRRRGRPPVRGVPDDATRRRARGGGTGRVRGGSARPEGRARVRPDVRGGLRPGRGEARPRCGGGGGRADRARSARAARPPRLAGGQPARRPRPRGGRGRRPGRGPSALVIEGLLAALGWGSADFLGAVVGRRIGSLWTVIIAQVFAALAATAIVVFTGDSIRPVAALTGALALNAIFTATAYVTHYRALELGPVAVVSPVGATYALVGVVLAIVFLGERPSLLALTGGVVTVVGVMLTSTDLRKLRAGTHGMPPGLPWAVASAIGFGVGGFFLAYLSLHLGWVVGMWASRWAELAGLVVVGLVRSRSLAARLPARAGIGAAIGVGAADLVGVTAFSIGTQTGLVSIVLVASAVFPLIAVGLSVAYLGERPVPNQYVGVGLVAAGLVLLGLA